MSRSLKKNLNASRPSEHPPVRVCASLSHTHYWYGVGMLEIPAVTLGQEYNVEEFEEKSERI